MHWLIKTGAFMPSTCYTNDHISKIVNTSHEWIVSRAGIHSRRICSDSENVLTMTIGAVSKMQLNSNEIAKIKIIIVATSTNHRFIPSIASTIHKELLCHRDVIAFDINDACNGFVQSMSVAYHYVKDGGYALVIGADHMSSLVDWTDRSTCVLFGDGAGAVLFDGPAINKFHCSSYTLSEYNDALTYAKHLIMDGNSVFCQAIINFTSDIIRLCDTASITPNDVDYYILHQANERILNGVAERIRSKSSYDIQAKMINIIRDMGNTSAATIPIAMDSIQKKIISQETKIVLSGFAAGLRGGSCIIW